MFLICGEALFDLFGEENSDISIAFDARIGGSPLNVAIGLARLEENAAFFGGISTDTLGQKLAGKLIEEGVSDACLVRSDYLTTLSIVQKDPDGVPAYTFYGNNSADRMVTHTDLPDLQTPPAFLHIGSYTALVDPVASAFKALIDRERDHTLISFDPNIRPTVVPDMQAWRKNTDDLAGKSDLIKVSDEDLSLIAPGESIESIAAKWLANGTRLVVVTRGAKGATAFHANGTVDSPVIAAKVIDTVGAGDTFQAALLSGLKTLGATDRPSLSALDTNMLHKLLEFAVRAAAITCSRRGADLPRKAELETIYAALQ